MDFPLDLSLLRWEDDTITTYSALPKIIPVAHGFGGNGRYALQGERV